LRADVPFGLFLSGGIDSASIATLTARFATRGVAAFTCGFDVPGAADERTQAEKVARHFGYDFEPVEFTAADFWQRLPALAWAFDEPCADYAALPVHKLAEVARGRLRVVLTGEGGDELFGGYGRYRKAMSPLSFLRRRGPQARFERAGLLREPTPWRSDWQAAANGARGETELQRAQSIDVETWLHADLLLKLDRCLMAYGLEGRTPFLDPKVAAFAETLPDAWKVRGRFGKAILRDWLAAHCPPAQPFARKQGFTVPVGDWIAPHAARLGPLIAADPLLAQVLKPEAVRALFAAYDAKAHGGLAWSLLFHAVWAGVHVHGRPVDGDVWAALG
jgi:asparagine synthase (glutamine-hydrolysing)